MKSCPTCRRLFDNDAGFCPVDGVALKSASLVPPEPSSDDPRIGQQVGDRYQLRRVIADGGMGRVYEALDLTDERRVALKMLHHAVARDPVAVERFKQEYESSKHLPHEHIAEVFDFFKLADGGYALVMEYLEGEELRALINREKTVRPGRVIRMLSQLSIGLDEAHRRSLIHRDLKPDNIFLCGTPEGDIAKLLDFGSVKDKSGNAKKLTVIGTTIGSPFYMAPEQAQGLDTIDHRADVWAIAAITYEALCGKVPFDGPNGTSILVSILTNDPAPVAQRAKELDAQYPVPVTVDDVLDEAFAKVPDMRIESVSLLATKMGRAYGLEGTPEQWATTTEQELQARIDQALPELLKRVRAVPLGLAEADPFAAAEPDPFASGQADPFVQAPKAPIADFDEPEPPSTQRRTNTTVYLVIGILVGLGVLILLGAFIALMFVF